MDAVTYLKQEHRKIKKMLINVNKLSNEKVKLRKFKELCKYLPKHEKTEEKKWYPPLRKDPALRSIINHLIKEEKAAGKAIKKLLATDYGKLWKLKFAKLKKDVLHHAKEEETKLFPKARNFLDKKELNKLGTTLRKFKASLK
ncbi:MAG: hemerythrin domain-containing protein [Pseudomonadota bacterium]